jgi:hypothetical protein
VWNKGSAIGHKQADFKIGDRNDTIRIDGVSSEKSARILQMPNYGPGADLACPVLLANYRFGTGDPNNPPARDGEVIRCEAEGPLSIVACRIGSAINRQQLRIYYAPDPPPGAFDFIGNGMTNDGDGNIFPRLTANDGLSAPQPRLPQTEVATARPIMLQAHRRWPSKLRGRPQEDSPEALCRIDQ